MKLLPITEIARKLDRWPEVVRTWATELGVDLIPIKGQGRAGFKYCVNEEGAELLEKASKERRKKRRRRGSVSAEEQTATAEKQAAPAERQAAPAGHNMRDIKYRAWVKSGFDDDIKPFMVEVGTINFVQKHVECSEDGDIWDFDEIELMQFTGLTDKNGTEIYEGDLLRSDWHDDKQRVGAGEVVFSSGRFTCRGLTYDLYLYPELEVVGNIYENPELINPKT